MRLEACLRKSDLALGGGALLTPLNQLLPSVWTEYHCLPR